MLSRRQVKQKYKREMIAWYRHYMSQQRCERCGEDHPATLTWHHREPRDKTHAVSYMVSRGYSRNTIMEEIDKCDCLCANCHAILHFEEKNGVLDEGWR